MKESDVNAAYVDALNDRERVRYMTSIPLKNTHEDVVKYVVENSIKPDVYFFGIFEGEVLLGTSRIHDIDQKNKTAWMGILIFNHDPALKGLGTSVIEGICSFAFRELKLKAVQAGIFLENIASVRAFEKAGFVVFDQSVYEGRPYQKWIKRAE